MGSRWASPASVAQDILSLFRDNEVLEAFGTFKISDLVRSKLDFMVRKGLAERAYGPGIRKVEVMTYRILGSSEPLG